jgi:hypothetical protein
MAEPDARRALPKLVAGIATLNARIAPMLPVFDAVAGEPAGEVWARSRARRREDMAPLVDALARKTPLRRGMTRRRAADLLFFVQGPECYRELVLLAGWPPKDWVRWASETLGRDLFGDAAG